MTKRGMRRIICHWTAGSGTASGVDREHYHRLVEQDGTIVTGTEAIEDNIVTSDGDYAAPYAAPQYRLNRRGPVRDARGHRASL